MSNSFSQLNSHVAALAARDPADVIYTLEFEVPQPGFRNAVLILDKLRLSDKVAFRGYVYVHPRSTAFDAPNDLFRERHLSEHFALMATPMPRDGRRSMHTDLSFNLTPVMARLAERHAGQPWVITVTACGNPLEPRGGATEAAPATLDAAATLAALAPEGGRLQLLP